MSLIDDLKKLYLIGNIVEKLIYINIAIFVITLLASVFQGLYKSEITWIVNWFALDDNFSALLTKPWSIITYGFLHSGFLHILFNLVTLYFVGNLFLQYFTEKQLLQFYILGTVFGGIAFMLSHNYFPLFEGKNNVLLGASAGISAIFLGISTYIPNYEIKIRFIGFVKLWYLTAIWVGLDVLGLIGNNAGGHFAHLGGSLFGYLYVLKASNKEIDILGNFFSIFQKKQKPMKTVYKSDKKNARKTIEKDFTQQQVDEILDKISKSGYDTLTKAEKEFLFKQGRK